MTTRLVLLCAGATASARAGRFPDPDEPLDAPGRARAAALRIDGPRHDDCLVTPSRSASETAAILGFAATAEPALRDLDHGEWTGRGFEAIAPAALAAWAREPEAGAPGGESLAQAVERVAPWLDGVAAGGRRVLAVTHAGVVRAILAHALALPVRSTLAIDVAPLSLARLSFHDRWRLQELRAP